ncbi:MAG: DNA primase small subunit PriS [Candidatus Bathyarchaeum sp.]|nr:MAG: DNA primase small subunit PriS [Candidatus Bathyarchaeum sp.]
MSSLSQRFIQDRFSDYYKQNSALILPPTSIEKREFGFLIFEKRMMLRHRGFREVDGLRSSLSTIVPSDVYYSSAYYESPEEEMKAKGWLGADLIFDIDADHISTPCATLHDLWVCNSCGASGKGGHSQKCPACGGGKFKEKTWPCEVCLEAAKAEAIKLIDVLTDDFGFSTEMLTVAFSGHRGYHVHVESEKIHGLDSIARKEIVDYVMGIGLEAEFHGVGKSVSPERMFSGPDLNARGWRGRVARGTYDFLLTASTEELEKAGLRKGIAKKLVLNREALLESWKENGPWGGFKGLGLETWKKIAQYGVEKQSVKIDTVVTPDINRLIRLSNTLHGKTGLKKLEFSITDLEDFDPLRSAVAFKEGEVTVNVSEAPQFRVEDRIYGPFERQRVELPTAAALMLLCKGVAKVVQ